LLLDFEAQVRRDQEHASAFGWSTTLQIGAAAYHQLNQAVAWPWHTLWPAAAPDLSLVEQARFFRAGEMASHLNPARWGEWWPFVTMLWLFYVILIEQAMSAYDDWRMNRNGQGNAE
jgi:hypothetical protein